MSKIVMCYNLKPILAIYIKEPNEARIGKPFLIYATAVIAIVLNLIIGLFPSLVIDLLG